MFFGGNDRLADDVGEVSAYDHIHRHSDGEKRRPCEEAPSDPEESAKYSNDKAGDHQVKRADVCV